MGGGLGKVAPGTKVVVAGAGCAGLYVAHKLDRDFDVTLIDTKDFFEYTPATVDFLAAAYDPAELEKRHRAISFPLTDSVKRGTVKLGRVTSVAADGKSVTMDTGETVPCDILVLATGSTTDLPWKVDASKNQTAAERLAEAKEWRGRIAESKQVLVIGGGATGVEVAAEICDAYKGAHVHLVHNQDALVSNMTKASQAKAAAFFANRNATLYLGEKAVAENKEGTVWKTSKTNQVIEADIVFKCVGIKANSAYMQEHLAQHLDERGFIKVTPTYQLEGLPHVFALGDVSNIPMPRMAKNCMHQASLLVPNLYKQAQGKPLKQLSPDEPPGFVVSLGQSGALMEVGCIKMNGWSSNGSAPALAAKQMFPAKTMKDLR